MESKPAEDESKGVKTLFAFYSNYLWNRLATFVPSRNSNFLGKIPNLGNQAVFARSRRHRACLPLPLPTNSPDSLLVMTDASSSRVFDVLEDIMEHMFTNLRNIQKNLDFWQSRAEGSNARKVYFMVFERGPRAFVSETFQFLREWFSEGSSIHHLSESASAYIYERVAALTTLRSSLATFLAEMYIEVDRCGEELLKDPEKALPSLLLTINGLFSKLEASIGHLHAVRQRNSSTDGSYSFPLMFEELPEVNQEGSQWTDCEMRDAIHLVYENLHKLDSYTSLMASCQTPKAKESNCILDPIHLRGSWPLCLFSVAPTTQ